MTATQVIADRYEILSELGSGGFAIVYKVRDRMLNKEFALKMLKNEYASGEQLMRFQQEAKLVSKLNHPSISTVFHCGLTDDNQPFLIMEFHDGKTLLEIIESGGPIDVATAIDMFIQMCDGMAYSHDQSIIHRDLKTANMMIVSDGGKANRVKILDFGLGKMTSSSAGVLTRPGMALGSPAYMSPEHAHGKQLDERSDIYSLGCIMFEVLTGVTPIRGHSQVDTIIKQISQSAPSLSSSAKGKVKEFPEQLEKIVAKALDKEPAKRFQSMRELREALAAVDLNAKKEMPTVAPGALAKPAVVAIAALVLGLTGWGTYVAFFAPVEVEKPTAVSTPVPKKKAKDRDKSIVYEIVGKLGPEDDTESSGAAGDVAVHGGGAAVHEGGAGDTASGGARSASKLGETRDLAPSVRSGSSNNPIESAVDSGLFWDKVMSDDWQEWRWEGGIVWMKKFGVSEEELIKASKDPKYRYISLYSEKSLSLKGLKAVCDSPYVRGIGLGNIDISPKMIELVGTAHNLEWLYLDRNLTLKDKDLKPLTQLKKLVFLSLARNAITDEALIYIGQIPSLRWLKLEGQPKVTGTGLKYLAHSKKLEAVFLAETYLKDDGWKALSHLKSLKGLSADRTNLNDRRLELLKAMPLQQLDVSNTDITERSLQTLGAMKLKLLHIWRCRFISEKALDQFQKDNPKCQVERQGWSKWRNNPLLPDQNAKATAKADSTSPPASESPAAKAPVARAPAAVTGAKSIAASAPTEASGSTKIETPEPRHDRQGAPELF